MIKSLKTKSPGIWSRLFHLSIWNVLAALINFLTNVLIAKVLGIEIFGDLAYILALSGIFSLVFIILPTDYSLFRYQDDSSYKYLLSAFYILGIVALFILCLLLNHITSIPFWLFFLFALSFSLQGYMDISLQAENKLKLFYIMLFLIAISKAGFILITYVWKGINGFEELVKLITFAQLTILSIFLFKRIDTFFKGLTKIKEVINLLINERKLFATYYYNTGIKKLNSNIIILLFQPLVSKEILGLFALFMKVHLFIFGMVRTLESMMINRISKEKFDLSFLKNAPYIALFVQLCYIVTGLIYMKYISDSYYITLTLVLSFLVYPFVWFIRSRANFLSAYKNLQINISYSLFLGIILIGYVVSRFLGYYIDLNRIVYLFTIASIIQMLYLIYMERRIIPKNQLD